VTRRRIIEAVVVVTCLALATALLLSTPLRDRTHERVARGEVGTAVAGEEVRLEVHTVRAARTALVDGQEMHSPGVFVVLDVTAQALRKPTSLTPRLVADEVTYEPSTRVSGKPVLGPLTAGFPQRGSLVFELPEDAIPGSVLRVSDHTTLELPVYVEVPLGLDSGQVAAELAVDAAVELVERVDEAEVERSYR
jgi:hypothetical protein